MVQPMTVAEAALQKSHIQAGPDGFYGQLEIDFVTTTDPGSELDLLADHGAVTGEWAVISGDTHPVFDPTLSVSDPNRIRDGSDITYSEFAPNIVQQSVTSVVDKRYTCDLGSADVVHQLRYLANSSIASILYVFQPDRIDYSTDGVTWAEAPGAWSSVSEPPRTWDQYDLTVPIAARFWRVVWEHTYAGPSTVGTVPFFHHTYTVQINGFVATEQVLRTRTLVIDKLDVDRARKMAAAQLDASMANEDGARGWYTQPIPLIAPNNPVRGFAGYGDIANRIQIFTGLLDRVAEDRDPRKVSIKARSRMKWLLEQGFEASASQVTGETGAVRTEDNGVYLGKSPEYIVGDILDRAGWPSADRVLHTTGMTIAEYDLSDATSWAEQISGPDRLCTVAGCDLWEDELGVLHFEPNALTAGGATTADYGFEAGVDVLQLHHEVDDENRATRVKVTGPMTSTVPIWKEEWSTTVLLHPTGSMFVDAAPTYLYVVDGVTQYLYKIRQSDRKVVAKWNLGSSLSYAPLGLSKDPTDPSIFLVLDADWRFGATSHAKVRKFDSATKALLSTTNLPDGDWSDMKFDGSHLWLTNFSTDRLYKKTYVAGGTAGATASYLYAGHTGPSGMYLGGTTIGLFFNGGAAFYLVDTSAPGTITGTQSTKGTHIEGGELDTVTNADLYATAAKGDFGNSAGYIWKFALSEEITTDVSALAADQALEDALGFQSDIGYRVHDLHPLDPAHSFETRLVVVALKMVASLAQAGAVAAAQLVLLEALRRVMDLATLGNPAIQINDVVGYYDPVAGISSLWLLDAYRSALAAGGTFTTSMSVLPLDVDWVPGS